MPHVAGDSLHQPTDSLNHVATTSAASVPWKAIGAVLLNPWAVGIGSGVTVGLVVWFLTSRWERHQRPTADDIALAQQRAAQARENAIHAAADALYKLMREVHQRSSMWDGLLKRRELPDEGFERVAAEIEERWLSIKPALHVLERDDIPERAQKVVDDFVRLTAKLALDLRPFHQRIANGTPIPSSDLEYAYQYTTDHFGLSYEALAVLDDLKPYRRRLIPSAR